MIVIRQTIKFKAVLLTGFLHELLLKQQLHCQLQPIPTLDRPRSRNTPKIQLGKTGAFHFLIYWNLGKLTVFYLYLNKGRYVLKIEFKQLS